MSLIAQTAMLGLTGKFTEYSPLELGPSLLIWWDAENAVEDDGVLVSVPNAGQADADLLIGKTPNAPILSGAAGEKIITHNGTADYLEASAPFTVPTDWTFYAVAAQINAGTFIQLGDIDARIYFAFADGWYHGNDPTVQIGANNSDWQILKHTNGATGNDLWRVGCDGYEESPIMASWKTIIVINRQLSAGEASAIENWLAGRL